MKVKVEAQESPYEFEPCTEYTIDEDDIDSNGDASNLLDDPGYKESLGDASEAVRTYKSKYPSDYTEVNDDTLRHLFGKNWNGSFADCQYILERRTSVVTTQLHWYNYLYDYIGTIPYGSTKYSTILAQINGSFGGLTSSISGIQSCIKNLQDFKFSTESPMAILNSTDYALANLEYMFINVEDVIYKAQEIYNRGVNLVNNVVNDVKKVAKTIENVTDNIKDLGDKVKKVANNIVNNLANLPRTLMNKFLNCTFVQNMFQLPMRIYAHIAAAFSMITSIRWPTNLKQVIAIFSILRQAVAQIKNAVKVIKDAVNQVKAIKNMIKRGNWYGILGVLNTQGSMPGFKIVEKPSSFAAKYPANSAYTTSGGHTIEIDNTEGHERMHIEHKSGTSFEMTPSGDLLGKVKKDFQTIVDGKMEMNIKDNTTIVSDKKVDFTFDSLSVTVAKDVQFTASSFQFINDPLFGNMNINSNGSVIVSAGASTTVTSIEGTAVTSLSTVSVTANANILIDAPIISIGGPLCHTIFIAATNTISHVTNTLISLVGATTQIKTGGLTSIATGGTNRFSASLTSIGRS